jgi:hypothetical protein
VKTELGPDVPLHFSQFHPEYLLKNLPLTPLPTLERAKAICDAEGLHYVYIGNIPGHPAESTYCPKCRRVVVERAGFAVRAIHLARGKCQFCQQVIPGVWDGLLQSGPLANQLCRPSDALSSDALSSDALSPNALSSDALSEPRTSESGSRRLACPYPYKHV